MKQGGSVPLDARTRKLAMHVHAMLLECVVPPSAKLSLKYSGAHTLATSSADKICHKLLSTAGHCTVSQQGL